MTQQKEIEEAICTAEDAIGGLEYYEKDKPEYVRAIKLLQDLAQRYLEIEGFPEDKEVTNGHDLDCECFSCIIAEAEVSGYNQALKDCKLSLLKKMFDGLNHSKQTWYQDKHDEALKKEKMCKEQIHKKSVIKAWNTRKEVEE